MARMADAKLSPNQCGSIVKAKVTMLEELRLAQAERGEVLQPLEKVLQGEQQTWFAAAADFHNLVDHQLRVRNAEYAAIEKYTAIFLTDAGALLGGDAAAALPSHPVPLPHIA
ncbi:hypothetical protein WJX73_004384 [Symbiochloris irregularis]|uniref:Uncharacterized protein n=1 Tax=Symbiochloris irregularis TaxID=706552 RepID=A0AAW1PSQ7_9CHLO